MGYQPQASSCHPLGIIYGNYQKVTWVKPYSNRGLAYIWNPASAPLPRSRHPALCCTFSWLKAHAAASPVTFPLVILFHCKLRYGSGQLILVTSKIKINDELSPEKIVDSADSIFKHRTFTYLSICLFIFLLAHSGGISDVSPGTACAKSLQVSKFLLSQKVKWKCQAPGTLSISQTLNIFKWSCSIKLNGTGFQRIRTQLFFHRGGI